MTGSQRIAVRRLRHEGKSYAEISAAAGLPVGTVKAFCSRNGIAAGRDGVQYCGSCGALVVQTPKKRHKRFCSDRCRYRWWNRSRGAQAGKGAAHTCACCGAHYFSYHGSSKYCGHPCYIARRFGRGIGRHDERTASKGDILQGSSAPCQGNAEGRDGQ